jgi:eukaryotic-like serine/threonine-protein kinase
MPAGEEVNGAGSDPARIVHDSETIVQGSDPNLGGAHHAAGDPPRPVAVTQLDEFSRALVEIGLIDATELEFFAADFAEGVLGLSRALVKAGKLTPYQAAAVYQKKSHGLLIGNYLILDKLGQGGMGVVFKARHRRLGRIGALKILPPSFARDRSAVMRFRREVEAAGRLKHPNLVAAHDADEDRGVHFLVMDYVEGRDLDRVVRDRGPMQVTQAVDCLIQAARGLEAAHTQGIVHRDIKPGNLMLDNAGTVRVLDLGLARIIDAANPFNKTAKGRLTESGMYMGTVDYMAPEQAEDSHRVDHRADIYSLGCTFHYLLTGQEPFVGETVLKRLMAHMERPAPSLRIARPDVPPALDAVYLKMMAKRPDDRPASMTEVIALLEASKTAPDFNTEVGAAAPKSKPELKVFNEQPLKRAGAPKTKPDPSVFALSRETGSPMSSHELNPEDLVMDVRPESPPTPLTPAPRPAPTRAQPLKRLATTTSRKRPARRGPFFIGVGLTAVLAAAFVSFVSFSGSPPRNNATDRGTDGHVPTPPVSPPHFKIATPIPPPQPAIETEPYVETAQFVGHAHNWVEAIRVLPDGKRLVTTSADQTARLWDIATRREIRRFWHPAPLRPIALVPPNGRRAVTGCGDGIVRLWDLESGKLIRTLATHSKPVWSVAVSQDGHVAVSGGDDKFVLLSDVDDGSLIARLTCPVERIWSLAISPDGGHVIAGGTDGLWLGERSGSEPMQSLTAGSKKYIWDVTFDGDGRHAVSANAGGLTYWDLHSKRALLETKLDGYQVRSLAAETDGHRLVFGAARDENRGEWDGVLGSWDLAAGGHDASGARRGPSRQAPHLGLTVLPPGGIATADLDGIARIWEPSAAIATARELTKAGREPDALAWYDKAIAQRPVDTRLLIERGRVLARLGQGAKAGAEFERAAQLAPENPQLFVNAGWWAAGPYPGGVDLLPAIDTSTGPDPSKPAPASGSEERLWRDLPIGWPVGGGGGVNLGAGQGGGVDLGAVFPGEYIAAFAMTFVYSSRPRDVVLLIGIDDRAQVSLNGREILRLDGYTDPDGRAVAVSLQSGRNVILVKIANTLKGFSLHLRIADSPSDFARGYAEAKKWDLAYDAYTKALALEPENGDWRLHGGLGNAMADAGRWKEAKGAYERFAALEPGNFDRLFTLAECYLALRDFASYRRLCEATIKKHGKTQDHDRATSLLWLAALIPNAVRNYAELVEIGKKLMNVRTPDPNDFTNFGAILHRAGQYPSAIGYLERSIAAKKRKDNAFDWVFIAMARHMSRQPGDRDALEQARALSKSTWTRAEQVQISALLEEAQRELDLPPPP